uniref:Uncharacterized protein n=1 Tax=Piliocolobus tephrosceles TaxID=591936 RepID=A0A8C9LLZ3_9PRIM
MINFYKVPRTTVWHVAVRQECLVNELNEVSLQHTHGNSCCMSASTSPSIIWCREAEAAGLSESFQISLQQRKRTLIDSLSIRCSIWLEKSKLSFINY